MTDRQAFEAELKQPVVKSDCGVWMSDPAAFQSFARKIAERVILLLEIDPSDFRLRDKLIFEINPMVEEALNHVEQASTAHWQAERERLRGLVEKWRSEPVYGTSLIVAACADELAVVLQQSDSEQGARHESLPVRSNQRLRR